MLQTSKFQGFVSFALILLVAPTLSGCNGTSDLSSNTSSPNGSSTKAVTMVATNGCSVASASGGALISCGDGSSAFIANGVAGATGASGLQGATGLAGAVGATGARGVSGATGAQGVTGGTGSEGGEVFVATDGNGNQIGDYVIGIPYNGNFTVWSNALAAYAQYMSGGIGAPAQIPQMNAYYTSTDCSGQPYTSSLQGSQNVQAFGTQLYKISSVSSNLAIQSQAYANDGITPVCSAGSGTMEVYRMDSLTSLGLSDPKIPLSAAYPVQFQAN